MVDPQLQWPVAEDWVSLGDAAAALNLYRSTAEALFVSEFAATLNVATPTCIRADGRLFVRRDAVDALAAVPYVGDDLPIALLSRQMPRTVDGQGWHANLTDDEVAATIGTGIPFRNLPQWCGFPLVAHIAGFVITAAEIVSATYDTTHHTGSAVLDFTSPAAAGWRGHRFSPPRTGSPIVMSD